MTEEIHYLSAEQVSRLYERIVETTGGEHGFLSKSNLDYLLDTVKDVGERLSREQAIVKKAAFLLYNVIVIHPFLNGNKRTAYELVRHFLASNGYKVKLETKETYRFLLEIASGKISESEVEKWVATHLSESPEERTIDGPEAKGIEADFRQGFRQGYRAAPQRGQGVARITGKGLRGHSWDCVRGDSRH